MSQRTAKMLEELAKPKLMAVYAHIKYPDTFMTQEVEYSDYDEHHDRLPEGAPRREKTASDYVRISEVFCMIFEPLKEDLIIQNAVRMLDDKTRRVHLESGEELVSIARARAELLAISYEAPADDDSDLVVDVHTPAAPVDEDDIIPF